MAEVSEITYSQLEKRLDAEYHRPRYLEIEKLLKGIHDKRNLKLRILREISTKIKTSAFYGSIALDYRKQGMPFLRVSDIRNLSIDTSDLVYLSDETSKQAKSIASLSTGDIIISKGGTLGHVAVIPEEIPKCKISRDIIGVSLTKEVEPEYVCVFLTTKYGSFQVERGRSQQVQPHLTLERIGGVKILIPPSQFQKRIAKIVKEARVKRKLADELYKRAEKLLLKEFGIAKLELVKDKPCEIRFSEVKKYKRLDAEHYKPEYKQIIEILENSDFELQPLKDSINISKKIIDPTKKPDEMFTYIELANVNPSTGEIEDYEKVIGYKAPSRARMLLKRGDVLVPSLSGSLENIAQVPEELDGSVGSTGFFVISSNSFYSEFLFLLFKSDLIKKQLEQKTGGTIMTAVSHKDFENILVPIIPKEKQIVTANFIKDSLKLRKESKELIQKAKQEVEQLIEQEAKYKSNL